ncbi:MAG: hypothetical protein GTN76_16595 [Candidatus Aenigmarchaeota archaeon]|nr:hypothetical protein [Candidatus Aenigmarchaeota archaeon]
MRSFMILIVLVGGAVIVQSSAFTQTDQDPDITATESDIFVTPATNPDFFAGFVGGDGDRSIPGGKIDWSIGNCRPFTRPTTEDLVISACVGDYHNIADWKERMRIRKDGMLASGRRIRITDCM